MNHFVTLGFVVTVLCLCVAEAAAPKKPAGTTVEVERITLRKPGAKPALTKPKSGLSPLLATPLGCGCAFVDPKVKCKPLDTSLDQDGFRVKGGTDVKRVGAYPYQAYLRFVGSKPNTFGVCGGTLIGEQIVLTAAHCFYENEKSTVPRDPKDITLGVRDLEKDVETMFNGQKVKKMVFGWEAYTLHGGYVHVAPNSRDDIALIKLDKKAPVTWNIRPACLPDKTFIHYAERPSTYRFTVTGWGDLNFKDTTDVNILQEAPIKPQANAACVKYYGTYIDKTFLCAGGDEKDSCQGDSGGPLVDKLTDEGGNTKYYVVGVVAAGDECGKPGVPAFYSRVSEYLDWIKESAIDLM